MRKRREDTDCRAPQIDEFLKTGKITKLEEYRRGA